jgi:hypothetical protein
MPGFNYAALKLQKERLARLRKAQARVRGEPTRALRMLIARATMRNLLLELKGATSQDKKQLIILAEALANARGNRQEEGRARREITGILCNNRVNLDEAITAASKLQCAINQNIDAAKEQTQ